MVAPFVMPFFFFFSPTISSFSLSSPLFFPLILSLFWNGENRILLFIPQSPSPLPSQERRYEEKKCEKTRHFSLLSLERKRRGRKGDKEEFPTPIPDFLLDQRGIRERKGEKKSKRLGRLQSFSFSINKNKKVLLGYKTK